MDTREIARNLGVSPEIAPYLPELLADIWALGSWPERIVDLLRPLDLPGPDTRVLEPGCGKGAVGIPVARDLGFQIRGVDTFAPFLEEARARAADAGVADRVCYEEGDMVAALDAGGDYDLAILAGVGATGGNVAGTVQRLRHAVRPGGYMILDDGFLTSADRIDWPGYEYYRNHAETVGALTRHGDRVIREVRIPLAEVKAHNARNNRVIAHRVEALSARHPEMAPAFRAFQQAELDECRVIEEETAAAIWLLQRT